MLPLPVTAVSAAILGLMYIALSIRVVLARGEAKASLGDGSTGIVASGMECTVPLLVRSRTHANFAEYVPISLILLLFAELEGTRRWVMVLLAALLIVGRALHPFGMSRKIPNPFRAGGLIFTLSAILGTSIAILIDIAGAP